MLFSHDTKKRKIYLLNYAKNNPLWRIRIVTMNILFIISLLTYGSFGCNLLLKGVNNYTEDFVFRVHLFTVCIAGLPFFMGLYFLRLANHNCALPYSCISKSILLLSDGQLEYFYWKSTITYSTVFGDNPRIYPNKDKFLFSCDKKNIKSLEIDDYHICHIIGNGQLILPSCANSTPEDKTIKMNEFSFMVSFDDENAEEIIQKWFISSSKKNVL